MGARDFSGLYGSDKVPVPLEGVHVEAKVIDMVRYSYPLHVHHLSSIF